MSVRHSAAELVAFASTLLQRAGLDEAKAQAVADILVEADLMGHTTHGLALLPPYLAEIEKGAMTRTGDPSVIADFPAEGEQRVRAADIDVNWTPYQFRRLPPENP